MRKSEIADLRPGDRLYVRHRWAHDPKTYVYDVEVAENRYSETQVDILIHYPGQIEHSILYYSGRTPHRHGYLATDFFRALPTEDHIGPYVYRPTAPRV